MTRESCPYVDDAGAYALSALAPRDTAAFEAHLSACEGCRHEVAELRTVVQVLPMGAPQIVPPPELKDRIMRVVTAEAQLLQAAGPEADRPPLAAAPDERGRWRWRLPSLRLAPAAALACALIVLGVGGGTLLRGGDDDDGGRPQGPSARTLVAKTSNGARAVLQVRGDEGTLVLRNMPPAPANRVYQVWLRQEGRTPKPTRTLFSVPRDGRATVKIGEPLRGADAVLVTHEPVGGSQVPTVSPVIQASTSA